MSLGDVVAPRDDASKEIVRMAIVLYSDGRLSVEGAPANLLTTYGMLTMAHDVIAASSAARAEERRIMVPMLVPPGTNGGRHG
jgi:hypothetical protein